MSKKNKIPKGVRLEFEDIDYWHKLPKNKYVKLPNGDRVSHYEYMKKFMHEYYGNSFSRSDPKSNILQTAEQKQEATRNNNSTNRDALLVSKKIGTLNAVFQIEKGAYDHSAEEWFNVFKEETYEKSLNTLIDTCVSELELMNSPKLQKIIFRIYFRLNKFIKLVKYDLKHNEDR